MPRIPVEDPFSVLNVFVPEPPSRPQVTPLFPPPSTSTRASITTTDGTQPPSQPSQPRVHAPIPVTVPSNRPPPVLATLSNAPSQTTPIASTSAPATHPPKKRRHWTIVRNAPARSRVKDKDTDATVDDTKTTWKVPRDAGPADYGTFATLLGELASSAVGPNAGAAEYIYGSEQRLYATIRSTVEHRGVKRKAEADQVDQDEGKESTETFWTDGRAEEAWDYLRDVVYGGVDGYAYVRSLAEFVAPSVYLDQLRREWDADTNGDNDTDSRVAEDADVNPPHAPQNHDEALPLGVPVARYVEDNLVDTVTRGRHGWLRDVFLPAAAIFRDDASTSPFHLRMAALPGAARAVASFKAWSEEQLDMAVLIRDPEELAKEGVLEGESDEGDEQTDIERALLWGMKVIEGMGRQERKVESGDVTVKVEAADGMDVDPDAHSSPLASPPKPEPESDTEEDPMVKRLRMNLLALAKRAPLDKIAKLPVELVPEHIRAIVPVYTA